MKAIVIEPDKAPRYEDIYGADGLHDAVDGYLESIRLTPDVVGWIDDSSKVRGDRKPVMNRLATLIARYTGQLQPGDWIAGNMVITGVTEVDGEPDVGDISYKFYQSIKRTYLAIYQVVEEN